MRIRIVGLCILAVVAISAITVSSASAAAPEFGRCVKATGGKFKDSKCTLGSVPGEEKYEWLPGVVKNKFTSKIKATTIATLETVGGTKITCTGETSTGEYTGLKTIGKMVATFTGCETSKLKCESPGKPGEGVIVTSPLGGPIGFETEVSPASKDHLASELHSESGNVAEFSCAGLPVVVKGSVLHKITANAMKLTATEKFTASKGEQKPDHFAGGTVDEHTLESNTNGGPFEEAGQTITSILTNEEKVEANSVV
ncbi:MAG TPA: hypothetical protein VGO29_00030 [Solirubrobacteraceae bacterium]|jgi:hypothetical protein|nr:hypothetical protein [Solirubrobacteraceae bacterium]